MNRRVEHITEPYEKEMAKEIERLEAEVERQRTALTKIDGIRNSIIGVQNINWSEHIYPLVAALEDAGINGLPYPEAKKNIGTLIDAVNRLEAEKARHADEVRQLVEALEFISNPPQHEPDPVYYYENIAKVALAKFKGEK